MGANGPAFRLCTSEKYTSLSTVFICTIQVVLTYSFVLKKTASCHLHFTHTHIYEYQLYAYETCCIVKLITVCENQDLHKKYPNIRDSGVIFPQSFQLFDLCPA